MQIEWRKSLKKGSAFAVRDGRTLVTVRQYTPAAFVCLTHNSAECTHTRYVNEHQDDAGIPAPPVVT